VLERTANKTIARFSVKTSLLIATSPRYLKLFTASTRVSFSVAKAVIFVFSTFEPGSCDLVLRTVEAAKPPLCRAIV